MQSFLNTIFVWIFFLLGVAAHTYWQADKSVTNRVTPWNTITQYLNRYSGLILIRTIIGIGIYGLWWSNPDFVTNITAAMAAKAQGVGWDKAAIVFSVLKVSSHNVFVALLFGASLDGVLYFAAKYVPGFKSVVPDIPEYPPTPPPVEKANSTSSGA